jgi:SAM-dependent methyltransferase
MAAVFRRRRRSRELRAEVDPLRRDLPVVLPGEREVTRRLHDRLDPSEVEEMRRSLDAEMRAILEGGEPDDRMTVELAFCVHLGMAEKTGLVAAMPPDDVHSMARGPMAAGGSVYYADLVTEALRRGGADPFAQRAALDFGCSSGRVVRVLKAALPGVAWHGCDPNSAAIRWASENLPGIDFRVSGQEPPLPLGDASLDFVYAISIWSHFAEAAALRWLDEMRRIVRPGGLLVLTVQGFNSIAFFGGPAEAVADLYARGFHYYDLFGEAGDWGVKSPEWGMAFLTPEWLLAHATPQWSLQWFAPGRAERNQDVVVLVRR